MDKNRNAPQQGASYTYQILTKSTICNKAKVLFKYQVPLFLGYAMTGPSRGCGGHEKLVPLL